MEELTAELTGKLTEDIMQDCIIPNYLIAPKDRQWRGRQGDPYMTTNLYPVYAGIVKEIRPKRLLEIGVRYGYSMAVALDAWPGIEAVVGIDMFSGGGWGGTDGAYHIACAKLRALRRTRWPNLRSLRLENYDTQQVSDLSHLGEFDLIYVDGDHSPEGCLHDLGLTVPLLAAGGSLVVDDMDHCGLRQTADEFAAAAGLSARYYPDESNRGRLVMSDVGATK